MKVLFHCKEVDARKSAISSRSATTNASDEARLSNIQLLPLNMDAGGGAWPGTQLKILSCD